MYHQWLTWWEPPHNLKQAAIRDRWNQEHPDDSIRGGKQGRDHVKKGILRAKEWRDDGLIS